MFYFIAFFDYDGTSSFLTIGKHGVANKREEQKARSLVERDGAEKKNETTSKKSDRRQGNDALNQVY